MNTKAGWFIRRIVDLASRFRNVMTTTWSVAELVE